ncbi:MAG TPA: branched-chain amino acid ABC transporter permease [Burkholderiales bacterium]|nr:branched-chain amino acid ABC transporter permease [Burkholderiales bacterium]
MAAEILQLLVFGVVVGSVLALGAIGVSLVFAILRFANFGHGDLMTVGAYVAFVLVAGLGFPLLVALPFAIAGAALAAVAVDQTVFRRLRGRGPLVLLISSFGMALVLRNVIQLVWGVDTKVYDPGIQLPIVVGDVRIRPDHLTIAGAALVLVTLMWLFLQKTRTGKAMRAMADNVDLARVSGIDAERVILWTWILGGGLAGAAGVLLALDTRLFPLLGANQILPIFAATILGGIGRPYGAIAGGFVIGIASELSTLVIEPVYKPAVAFAIMVLVLIARPSGIFAGR